MYSPPYNQVEDRAEVLSFMRANNFAVVVTATGGEPRASHLPVLVEERDGGLVIVAHMAKNNPQWEAFFDEEVLVVFHGPHAYVSPRWYAEKERVPTWNYAAVHAYGKVRAFHEPEAKRAAVAKLVAHHDPQWLPDYEKLSDGYMAGMLEAIVAFEIPVDRLETRWKLSQNRGREEMELITAELEKSPFGSERDLVPLMRKHLP
ncbi:MAG: FMN-binding negative transcriptional regulator [Betaproteobacteria bacterium]|nr:FMN-binding negative transcriptional regulator [Betaproteobacteria bacterium]